MKSLEENNIFKKDFLKDVSLSTSIISIIANEPPAFMSEHFCNHLIPGESILLLLSTQLGAGDEGKVTTPRNVRSGWEIRQHEKHSSNNVRQAASVCCVLCPSSGPSPSPTSLHDKSSASRGGPSLPVPGSSIHQPLGHLLVHM